MGVGLEVTDFGRRMGTGDMLKSVYDTDDDGKVDAVEEHADLHEDGGTDEIGCAGLAGRSQYVSRGNPSAWDFQVGVLTTNGNRQDLNLSGIVPAGATAIHMLSIFKDGDIDMYFAFYTKSVTNPFNVLLRRTLVADLDHNLDGIIACDSDRIIQYAGSNTTFTRIDILVRGWFV